MKVVIPMAGYGKRLRPLTHTRPKPLVNVAGQPMLKHLLDALDGLEIEEYIFIVGYLGDQIEEYIRSNFDFKASFVVQEELIGQAHAIYLAREYIDGEVIVLFSDTLFQADLTTINKTDADALAFVKEVEDPRRFGVVSLNEDGVVTKFVEKPDSMENRNVVIGLYYLRDGKAMIRAIETQMDRKQMTKGEFFIADAFQIMIDEGFRFKTENVSVWLDCGTPVTVRETSRWLLENGYDNSNEVSFETATIISPVNIHPDAKIDHAIIGPYTTISADCEVSFSIIRDSILDKGAVVINSLLDDSLIGRDAHVTGRYHKLNLGDSSNLNFGE